MTWTKILMFALLAGLTVGPASATWRFARRAVSGLKRRDVAGRRPVSSMEQKAPSEMPAALAIGSESLPSRRPFVF